MEYKKLENELLINNQANDFCLLISHYFVYLLILYFINLILQLFDQNCSFNH